MDLFSCVLLLLYPAVLCHSVLAYNRSRHKRATGKYAKSTLNNSGLAANVLSPVGANEGQKGVGFIPLPFALQGEPLMVK